MWAVLCVGESGWQTGSLHQSPYNDNTIPTRELRAAVLATVVHFLKGELVVDVPATTKLRVVVKCTGIPGLEPIVEMAFREISA